ncbi:fibronectin type III domain-containing protein, partial [Stenotrophomonas maltophilia group sp. RNC7]|uniref:fibronectin type III domain-containing protein n=1 Tax=Stenotrophomonas maltophilia group sp. RNC7 TaxID=3071467 RepID=UPI0027E1AD6C
PSQTEIKIQWESVIRATAYDIEVNGNLIEDINGSSYVHKGLQPLTDHTYRVRAKNAGGISDWSSSIKMKTLPYPPAEPTNVTAQPTKTSVTLNWDAVEGADGYEIEIDGMIIENGANISYIHDGLAPYSGHTYRIRAKNLGGKGPWSNKLDVTTHPEEPETPTNIMTTADQNSITLTWYNV